MIDVLQQKIKPVAPNIKEQFNILREYLQLVILNILDEKGYFQNLAFVGGTALRILYDLPRYSEDLDFSLIASNNYLFPEMIRKIEKELTLRNLECEVSDDPKKVVATSFIKFNTLLYQLGLSPHKNQKLSIKLEVDQNPPSGYNQELTMVSKDFLIGIQHYDLPSLFAGKLHALLHRKYTKARDWYDLLWFLGQKVEPNFVMLNHAVTQTQGTLSRQIDMGYLHDLLLEEIENTDFNQVAVELEPFLINADERRFFTKDYFLKIIK